MRAMLSGCYLTTWRPAEELSPFGSADTVLSRSQAAASASKLLNSLTIFPSSTLCAGITNFQATAVLNTNRGFFFGHLNKLNVEMYTTWWFFAEQKRHECFSS